MFHEPAMAYLYFGCSLILHLTEVVFRGIPYHRRAGVDASAVLLHDDARDNVLEGFVKRL